MRPSPLRHPASRAIAVLSLAAFACAGCASQRDHAALEQRVTAAEKESADTKREAAALRADLEATRQRLDNALRANADSSTDVMSSKQRLADMAGRMDELQHGVDELRRDVTASRSEIYTRIDEMKRAQSGGTPAPQVSIPQDKTAHFAQIRDAHSRREWSAVRALGPEFVNRYPTDERADEALYYVADADLQDGRPSSALGHFNRLLKLFPRSKVLDRTLFGMGDAYMVMHDCVNAKLAYEAVDKRFAKERLGADARAKLQLIAKNPPGLCAPS
jgi:TolA-binding protein